MDVLIFLVPLTGNKWENEKFILNKNIFVAEEKKYFYVNWIHVAWLTK